MPTPHNSAVMGDIAETVIMPGDPLRAKFIAEEFLESPVCYNKIRGMYGYTGIYKGMRISVQGSGMGMPSMAIYSHELFNEYGVHNIIRTGTAGAIADKVNLRDIIIAMSASTNSAYVNKYNLPGIYAPTATWNMVHSAMSYAENICTCHAGNILSSDIFYDDSDNLKKWQKMGVLGVEMETAALYMNASYAGKNALSILTVSDCPLKNLSLPADERETGFRNMIKIALETALLI